MKVPRMDGRLCIKSGEAEGVAARGEGGTLSDDRRACGLQFAVALFEFAFTSRKCENSVII